MSLRSTNKLRNKKFDEISTKKFYNEIISKKNPVIFDIGANKGQTIEFFLKIFKNPKIYAFEPSRDVYKILEQNYITSKNIILKNVAIDKKNIKRKIFYYHTFPSNNTSGLAGFYKINKSSKDHINLNNKSFKKKILSNINHVNYVEARSVDSIFDEYKIKMLDILKIDTQGNEENVLFGAKKSLRKIRFLKLEVMLFDYYEKNYSLYDIEKILRRHGFKLFNILEINNNPKTLKTDWVELLYYNSNIN